MIPSLSTTREQQGQNIYFIDKYHSTFISIYPITTIAAPDENKIL